MEVKYLTVSCKIFDLFMSYICARVVNPSFNPKK